MTDQKKHGGARQKAGRPRINHVPLTIRVRDDQVEKFRKLGGSAWVRRKIDQIDKE